MTQSNLSNKNLLQELIAINEEFIERAKNWDESRDPAHLIEAQETHIYQLGNKATKSLFDARQLDEVCGKRLFDNTEELPDISDIPELRVFEILHLFSDDPLKSTQRAAMIAYDHAHRYQASNGNSGCPVLYVALGGTTDAAMSTMRHLASQQNIDAEEFPLLVYQADEVSIVTLVNQIRATKKAHPFGLVVIDHFDKITIPDEDIAKTRGPDEIFLRLKEISKMLSHKTVLVRREERK